MITGSSNILFLRNSNSIIIIELNKFKTMAEKAVIAAVMEEMGVNPRDIPRDSHSLRFFKAHGFGSFHSHNVCSRSWKSAHAWCELDLKKQIISHRYTQDCQKCEEGVEPSFDDEAVRRMAEYAVREYLHRSGREQHPSRDPFVFDEMIDVLDEEDEHGPHDEKRCELCQELGRSCWKRQ